MIWEKLSNLTSAMCWKLIAQQVQTAIWLKPENDLCRLQNAERNLLTVCEPEDDTVPSWRSPLRNCLKLNVEQSNFQKLPPRPERLSIYSKSLEKIGWFLFMPSQCSCFKSFSFFLLLSVCIKEK